MANITKAISDKVYKEALKTIVRYGDISYKLQAIKSAKRYGVKEVAAMFEVSRVTIIKWIKAFSKQGIEGLRAKTGRGRGIYSQRRRTKGI